jgi:tripeptide aminopeptidase
MFSHYHFTAAYRFLHYVTIDTQSNPDSAATPSTEKQKNLGRLLVDELKQMGIADAHVDEWGYVYGTLPSNSKKNVPVICFCSHMDTSPDCSGENVKPVVHKNYRGGKLKLTVDGVVIDPVHHPDLMNQIGNDIITADGSTLLGADNKAGLAEIMDAMHFLTTHQEIKHGAIKILFTPDEEIGRGVDKVDLKKLGAAYAYTMDGESAGHLEVETFSADMVTITFHGVSAHPGFAKGKMESAIKQASEFISRLPKQNLSPETTEGKQGFVHPVSIAGGIEQAVVKLIIRDFEDERLKEYEQLLKTICDEIMRDYMNSSYTFEVTEQYRNFKKILDQHEHVIAYAREAIIRSGLSPMLSSVRGGTDGSKLSYMGLPCPNVFAGEHAFHSKQEWISIQDMQKAVETIVHLCMIWEENS